MKQLSGLLERTVRQMVREPYRFFFPLGMLMALAGVFHWPLYFFGITQAPSAYFHSSLQTQAYLMCFVVGFLMTAMPRFSGSFPAARGEMAFMAALVLANAVFLMFGFWTWAQLCFLGILVSLLRFAVKRIGGKKSPGVSPPLEMVWVPFAILHGIVGSVLMLVNAIWKLPAPWYQAAKLLNEQGFILCIVIGVGGFLAPRLMGTFRVLTVPGKMPDAPETIRLKRRVLKAHLTAGLLFFLSFGLGVYFPRMSYALRALIITLEYAWTCSWLRFPRTTDLYVRLLWVSLCLVVTGSWGAAVFFQYRTAMLHILFIGGFSLMIFAVATMVTLSHGGDPDRLRRPLPVLWAAAAGVFGSLGFRLAAGFFPEQYFLLLTAAGVLWSAAGLYWFFFSFPLVFRVMDDEELSRSHEAAKQRVVQLREGKTCSPDTKGSES